MATDVTMPRLSDSMEEGTVLKWLVEAGGEVKRGEPLAEIETDKANMTYEADTDGVLIEILAGEGDTVAVGEPIARVGEPREEPKGGDDGAAEAEEPAEPEPEAAAAEEEEPAGASEEPAAATEQAGAEPAPSGSGASSDGAGEERVKASPLARRMAGELGVELARIEGSGPGGRVVKADVEGAAESAPRRTGRGRSPG